MACVVRVRGAAGVTVALACVVQVRGAAVITVALALGGSWH